MNPYMSLRLNDTKKKKNLVIGVWYTYMSDSLADDL